MGGCSASRRLNTHPAHSAIAANVHPPLRPLATCSSVNPSGLARKPHRPWAMANHSNSTAVLVNVKHHNLSR